MKRTDPSRLLRWYPAAWRERYGDELLALLEDRAANDEPLTATDRAAIACAGLRERGRATHLFGDAASPSERVRAGTLLVLCAWAVFVVAGVTFAKYAERFDVAVPAASRALPWGAFRTVQIIAVVASLVVAAAALLALPALTRFLRDDGWATVRRPVRRAIAATLVTIPISVGVLVWAHELSLAARNGGDDLYGLAVVGWACACIATLGLWTAAAVAAGRRLPSGPRTLAIETVLAALLTTAMLAMTGATVIWWIAMAAHAPWFLHGAVPGTSGSAFDPRLAVTVTTMAVAVIVAAHGTIRATRGTLRLRRG